MFQVGIHTIYYHILVIGDHVETIGGAQFQFLHLGHFGGWTSLSWLSLVCIGTGEEGSIFPSVLANNGLEEKAKGLWFLYLMYINSQCPNIKSKKWQPALFLLTLNDVGCLVSNKDAGGGAKSARWEMVVSECYNFHPSSTNSTSYKSWQFQLKFETSVTSLKVIVWPQEVLKVIEVKIKKILGENPKITNFCLTKV